MGKNKKKTNKAADSNDPDALKVRLLNFFLLTASFLVGSRQSRIR